MHCLYSVSVKKLLVASACGGAGTRTGSILPNVAKFVDYIISHMNAVLEVLQNNCLAAKPSSVSKDASIAQALDCCPQKKTNSKHHSDT